MESLFFAEHLGIIAFALSGFFVAIKEKLDILGVFIACFLTSLGGGIARDAIISQPPYTFTHILPSLLVIVVMCVAVLFKIHHYDKMEQKAYFIISDSFGLVSFAISGAIIGLNQEYNFFGVVLLALVTAVGGGVLRDILLNRVPLILTSDFYATIAILVGCIIFILDCFGFLNFISTILVFSFGNIVRLLAYYRNWKLPKIN